MMKFSAYLQARKLVAEQNAADPEAVKQQVLTLLNGVQDINAKLALMDQLMKTDLPQLYRAEYPKARQVQQQQAPPQQQVQPTTAAG